MSQHRSRLQRKAERVTKSEAEKKFDAEFADANTELNKALAAANKQYLEDVQTCKDTRTAQRKEAYDAHKKKRDDLLKKYAKEEVAA